MGVNQFRKERRSNISGILKTRGVLSVKTRSILSKGLVATLILFCFLALIPPSTLPVVKADTTIWETFTSTEHLADGWLYGQGSNYSTTWDNYVATWTRNTPYEYSLIGQENKTDALGDYHIHRSVVAWDTYDLPNDANITDAIISVYIDYDNSTTDFNVTAQSHESFPTYPFMDSQTYYQGWYGTQDLGSRATNDSLSDGAYWNITLNEDAFEYIETVWTTTFLLRSSLDISETAPSDNSTITFATAEDANPPILYVAYSVDEGEGGGGVGANTFYFYGPYEDNGELYTGTAWLKITTHNNLTIEIALTSDGATADVQNWSFVETPIVMTWNISDSGNYSRTRYFRPNATNEQCYIFIPDVDLPFYLYAFEVNDFHGVTNAYLESMVFCDGAMRVVERQPLHTINTPAFYMAWSRAYQMRLVCDQGTLDLGYFTALSNLTPQINIPAGAFPETFGTQISVIAQRMNLTLIQANYTDNLELTAWVNVTIYYIHNNGTTIYVYNSSSFDSTYQVNWNSAENTTDYLCWITAYYNGTTLSWLFSCPYSRIYDYEPWESLNLLGDGLPIELQYLPPVLLIVFAALAFSYWHISAGAWTAFIMACVMVLFGWLPNVAAVTPITLGLAGFIAAGITIGEFKLKDRFV